MKLAHLLVPALVIGALAGCSRPKASAPAGAPKPVEKEVAMTLRSAQGGLWSLRSPAFAADEAIPLKHTCDGADVSPELFWSAPPKGTVEIALLCDDPDAPGGNFVHWVIYRIPPERDSLPEAVATSPTVPELGGALQGKNDFGATGYRGPCPPSGRPHHYHFKLYALNAATGLAAGAAEADVLRAMQGHIVAQCELVGLYARR
jgi:Raf kinase inhibitor-like YbhB/YbcL family protein